MWSSDIGTVQKPLVSPVFGGTCLIFIHAIPAKVYRMKQIFADRRVLAGDRAVYAGTPELGSLVRGTLITADC